MRTAIQPIRPVANVTELHRLTQADGMACRGHLTELDGRLYGLAGECGPNGVPNCNSSASWNTTDHTLRCPGTLFSIALDAAAPAALRVDHAFGQLDADRRNLDGYHPWGSVAVGRGGWLYGVTQMGGSPRGAMAPDYTQPGYGVLFRYRESTKSSLRKFETLYNFFDVAGNPDGRYPSGDVAVGPDGSVYGTCKAVGKDDSCGSVWRWRDGELAWSPLYAAGVPYGGLTWARGALHGVSSHGGDHGAGVYFTVDPETLAVFTVDSFDALTGDGYGGLNKHGSDNTPVQAPLLLSDGTLVVARAYAGPFSCGFVARLDESGITAITECEDIPLSATPRFSNLTGAMLHGSLAEGVDGMIYGVANYGGAEGCGGVYRVARDGSLFELVHSFSLSGPNYPYGGLTRASDGALYAVTFGNGAVIRIDPPT